MQPRHIGGRSRGRTALTVILSLLAVLLAVFCILSWMLFSDPNAGVALPKPSDTAVSKVAAASISGRETALTPEEVGGWLNGLLQDNAEASSRMGVSALSVTAGKDSTANVYFPVKYKGKRFGVLVNLAPSFDSTSEESRAASNSGQHRAEFCGKAAAVHSFPAGEYAGVQHKIFISRSGFRHFRPIEDDIPSDAGRYLLYKIYAFRGADRLKIFLDSSFLL